MQGGTKNLTPKQCIIFSYLHFFLYFCDYYHDVNPNLTKATMKFSDIPGHETAKAELRQMADSDRIPHALLIAGAQGVGKLALARAFVQYVYCTDRRDGQPCGRCPACLQTSSLNNPDVHWIYPVVKPKGKTSALSTDFIEEWKEMLESHPYMEPEQWGELIEAGNSRPAIYVNEAAEIARTASLSSLAYRYKTYVIWLPELMNEQTANKLLKLIEEPYEDTLFVLVSNHADRLLPTIFSRTRRLNLKPVPDSETAAWLTATHGVDPGQAVMAARLGAGSPGRALEAALNGGEQGEFGDIYRQMMRSAYTREVSRLKALSEEVAAMGREKNMRFLDYCSRMARENFIANLRQPSLNVLNDAEAQFSTRFAPFVNHRNVEVLAADTDRARRDVSRNANAKIVMFDYMLSLCRSIRVLGKG